MRNPLATIRRLRGLAPALLVAVACRGPLRAGRRRAARCSGPASSASSPSPTCTAPTRNWSRCCARPACVDAQDRWAAGRTHVVSLGDLLDRGADSRKVMDLLMRLQAEASAAGGQPARRARQPRGDEHPRRPALRRRGRVRVVRGHGAGRRARSAAQGVGYGPARAPRSTRRSRPAIFGHRAALGPRGKYGSWLLSQPVAITVNDTLFMHAGPSSVLRGMSLQELEPALPHRRRRLPRGCSRP